MCSDATVATSTSSSITPRDLPAFATPLPPSALLSGQLRLSSANVGRRPARVAAPPRRRAAVRMDTNPLLVGLVTMVGVGGGVGLLVFTEQQGKRTDERENTQVCTECNGRKETVCEICDGTGTNVIKEAEECGYCDGKGSIRCMNCAGSGIQPRFLDRLSPDDFLD